MGNAYLNAKCREKLLKEAGTKFGAENVMVTIIVRVLYGLNISGAARRAKLEETLKSLGYKSSEVDSDVRMKWDSNPNEDPYYKYML